MKQVGFISIALAVLLAGLARAESPRVAVLDFEVATAKVEGFGWDWAQAGMADLLQIQLEQQGLVLLDRDLIHSVLQEQRLAADSITAPDQLTLASLVNAQFLVTGRVTPLGDGRFRVEASALSVEAVEAVAAASSEGNFPKDLTAALERVARRISGKLQTLGVPIAAATRTPTNPKPESLIMFYRGLNACAHGQPESGVAYFMNAGSLDSDFSVPLLWEIKAYEMAGFTSHAAIRREEIADTLKRLGLEKEVRTNAVLPAVKPVLAVLNPVAPAGIAPTEAATLRTVLTHALLATDQVRLFAFESIGDAVAEQDLRLSSLFTRQQAPRYGRWLASDGLILCRVAATNENNVVLELSVVDPLNAAVMSRVQRIGPGKELPRLIRSAAEELMTTWKHRGIVGSGSPGQAQESSGTTPAFLENSDLRPVYRGLVDALARVRGEPGKSDSHRALADAFAATGRPKLAAYEIEQCLKLLDIHAPNADTTYLGTHRWLYWEPSPASGAVGGVNQRLIENMIGQLLDTYPKTLAAGCMRYNLAISAWRGRNWPEAITQAQKSRQILQPLIEQYDRNAKTGANRGDADCELMAATYFLEGSSLRQSVKTEEARSVFRQGLDFMRSFEVRNFCLPLGPFIGDFFGPKRVYGYGGDRPGIKTRIEQELATLEGDSVLPPSLALASKANEVVSATNAPSEDPDSGAAWRKQGEVEFQKGKYWQALECYQQAVARKLLPSQCPSLNTALVEVALDQDRSHPAAAAEKLRWQLGLTPGQVSWVEWFAVGRKYQTRRQHDLAKAIACYRSMIRFLENPEQGGFYHLEKEPCCERFNLRWGPSLGEVDLRWTATYDERWYGAAFYLAQCLIAIDQKEEAAEWLRRIAIKVGGDNAIPLLEKSDWNSSSWSSGSLGVRAAQMLKELHEHTFEPQSDSPKP